MNAKTEFLFNVGNNKVKCAHLYDSDMDEHINYDGKRKGQERILKIGYNEDDYNKFLKGIDFEYDEGFGGQELFGNIRLEDGTRLERGEYDGSEWRVHKVCPEIPEVLKQ